MFYRAIKLLSKLQILQNVYISFLKTLQTLFSVNITRKTQPQPQNSQVDIRIFLHCHHLLHDPSWSARGTLIISIRKGTSRHPRDKFGRPHLPPSIPRSRNPWSFNEATATSICKFSNQIIYSHRAYIIHQTECDASGIHMPHVSSHSTSYLD